MTHALFQPFDAVFTPEFDEYFKEDWSLKNEVGKLRAPLPDIKIGALAEYIYIQRGALPDEVKYRDVIVSEELAGEHAGIVDVKTTKVKATRFKLFPYVLERHYEKLGFYRRVGIEKIHHWSYQEGHPTLSLWFVMDIKSGTITQF